MARRIRNKIQIEQHRRQIADRYLKGESQYNIGQSLGLTQQMVAYDLAIIHRRWVKENQEDLTKRKFEELAKIDHLEAIYWRAWEASLARQLRDLPAFEQVNSDIEPMLKQLFSRTSEN